jgi:hypothetical protein
MRFFKSPLEVVQNSNALNSSQKFLFSVKGALFQRSSEITVLESRGKARLESGDFSLSELQEPGTMAS